MSHHSRQPALSSIVSATSSSHPQFIGPWKLGKTLGRGATGRVLLASHQTNGQKAAVKVVSKSELDDEGMKKPNDHGGLPYGIEREIIIMKLLTHPNVLRLYDVWETSKNLYLVLEYVEGGELFDLLVEKGPLPEAEAIKYFRQIVLGTAYCHALGICHRDLKPENLLLDSSLNVKLADFGMAALQSADKLLETSCGSPHYAAPEIVSGHKYQGFASDVWSCGVILFALLTGRLPFDDENIRDLLLKVQAGSFEMPSDLSYEAQDLIAKMLTVNPEKRIETSVILKHPLLTKHPMPNEDLISVRSLPHPQTASKSLGSIKNIDKQILQNLSILWNDRSQSDIIKCLLSNGPNTEKTFYALLLRYRHNQDDTELSAKPGVNNGKIVGRTNSTRNLRKNRASQISASSSRNRPVAFQYKNGVKTAITSGRASATSSVQNSPYRSPRSSPNKFNHNNSPYRGSPRRSPIKTSGARFERDSSTPPRSIPRNIYNEIVNAQNSSDGMPPPLPSKDSIDHYKEVEQYNTTHGLSENMSPKSDQDLMASANLLPSKAKRASTISKSTSKNRLSRRKSFRLSMTNGLKRNSITVKLLSTYAKLSGDSEWEYMDKQTKRTSATFAALCDKIFNQQEYDEDDENLVDEEEKEAREYEKLMEQERKKHEAELRARKELAKQRKRQKRRSLLSSRKLSILVKDDANNSESEMVSDRRDSLAQPKRQSVNQAALRSISEGTGQTAEDDDELTAEDLEKLKKRSVTQPLPRRGKHPILTRRPVSRLDPLWTAHENEKLTRAQDALESEYKDAKITKPSRQSRGANRESMISVVDMDDKRKSQQYNLPNPDIERSDLSDDYLSEIRKSRLLNSQLNMKGIVTGEVQPLDIPKNSAKRNEGKPANARRDRTLIGEVKIPKVTRKSRHFSNSNKRLSVLSLYSTQNSYHDLNSIVQDESNEAEARLHQPHMRTSYADRLNRADLPNTYEEDDEEPLDQGSVIDFDEHLANKRSSYYAGTRNNTVRRHSKHNSSRPISDLPKLPEGRVKPHRGPLDDPDETFATKAEAPVRRKSKSKGEEDGDYYGGLLSDEQNEDYDEAEEEGETKVFENIKLPPVNVRNSATTKPREERYKTKSMLPSAESMLIPDMRNLKTPEIPKPKPYAATRPDKTNTYPKPAPIQPPIANNNRPKPLEDSTNKPDQKKSKSIFRKLSWGTKKTMDDAVNPQLPSPANSVEERVPSQRANSFFRWLSGNSEEITASEVKRFNVILPKQEMSTALFALLSSWSNFGLKNLKNDHYTYIITGAISKNNAFNLNSCKFRININARDSGQKAQIVCARVKGSKVTTDTLFKEIEKVLCKEGVMDEK